VSDEAGSADAGGVGGDGAGLSALARQLAAGLASATPASSPAPDVPAVEPAPAAPPAAKPTMAVRRMPPAEAIAVATRILAPAGHRVAVDAAKGELSQPKPAAVAHTSSTTAAAAEAAGSGAEAADGGSFVVEVRLADGRTLSLEPGQSLTLGRQPGPGGVAIDNAEISRRHVTVRVAAGGVVAVDEHSTNGTCLVRDGRWIDLEPGVETGVEPGDRLAVPDDIWLAHIVERAGGR